jgi:glycine cleavage system H protein
MMSEEMLKLMVDKFIFRIPTDRYFSEFGVWVKPEGDVARLGVSDFVQQRYGDVAFADAMPVGIALAPGDELASVETIKVNVIVPSPVKGTITAINEQLEDAPEQINQDPYGAGWLALVELADWEADRAQLFDAPAYYERVREQAEEEMNA